MPKPLVSVKVNSKVDKTTTADDEKPSEAPIASVIDLRTETSDQEPKVDSNGQDSRLLAIDNGAGKQAAEGDGSMGSSTGARSFNGEDKFFENGNVAGSGRDVPTQEVHGILDMAGDGHGFLRPKFRPSDGDVYISASQIRKFMLRPGDDVVGLGRPPRRVSVILVF